ncbi:hypothetical protein EMIHUDRAFT_237941, partial [Emiliania huxleyi CCMP1516]
MAEVEAPLPLLTFLAEVVGPLGAPFWPADYSKRAASESTAAASSSASHADSVAALIGKASSGQAKVGQGLCRVDDLLVQRGHCKTKKDAKQLIKAGHVRGAGYVTHKGGSVGWSQSGAELKDASQRLPLNARLALSPDGQQLVRILAAGTEMREQQRKAEEEQEQLMAPSRSLPNSVLAEIVAETRAEPPVEAERKSFEAEIVAMIRAGGGRAVPFNELLPRHRTHYQLPEQLRLQDLGCKSKSSTGYRGVFKDSGRFGARCSVDGKDVYLGCFDTAVEAAVAYTRAAEAPLNSLGLPLRPGASPCAFYVQHGACRFGSRCRYNHPEPTQLRQIETLERQMLRPGWSPQKTDQRRPAENLFKTRVCRNWERDGTCADGANCRFAHGERELRALAREPPPRLWRVDYLLVQHGHCKNKEDAKQLVKAGRVRTGLRGEVVKAPGQKLPGDARLAVTPDGQQLVGILDAGPAALKPAPACVVCGMQGVIASHHIRDCPAVAAAGSDAAQEQLIEQSRAQRKAVQQRVVNLLVARGLCSSKSAASKAIKEGRVTSGGETITVMVPPTGYLCHNCRQPGHWIGDCPLPRQSKRPRDDEMCSSPGHFIADCPLAPRERAAERPPPPAGYVCRKCNQSGHWVELCQLRGHHNPASAVPPVTPSAGGGRGGGSKFWRTYILPLVDNPMGEGAMVAHLAAHSAACSGTESAEVGRDVAEALEEAEEAATLGTGGGGGIAAPRLETPEEISAWQEARRTNWPTRANIKRKAEEARAAEEPMRVAAGGESGRPVPVPVPVAGGDSRPFDVPDDWQQERASNAAATTTATSHGLPPPP